MKGFSILICTYNGEHKLEKVFSYIKLLKTELFGIEIILVNNNSSDGTHKILSQFAENNPFVAVKIISEKRSGKTNALITGFSKCNYEYVVICDDDNLLEENYINRAFSVMENDKEIGILGGLGFIEKLTQLPAWFSLLENAWAVGPQAPNSGEIKSQMPAVWGAGMVIRKASWDKLIKCGFNTFLTGRKMDSLAMAGEDTELCILIKKLGYKIFYEKNMVYRHDLSEERLTWKNLLNLWEGFSRSQVYFSLYQNILYQNQNNKVTPQVLWANEIRRNLNDFFFGSTTINFYKSLYIAFVENREGYLPGLEKRKYLMRVRELIRIKKSYAQFFEQVSLLRKSIDESNN